MKKNNESSSAWKIWSTQENGTWEKLFSRQLPQMEKWGSSLWLKGQNRLQLNLKEIPNFDRLNTVFMDETEWQLNPTSTVFADGQSWFQTLASHHFMITQYIRPQESLDYTPMPDVFHDSFGHLPFLMDTQFSRIIDTYSKVMLKAPPLLRKKLGHIWWFTVEFGMIKENSELKILGAGIASSFAETQRVMSGMVVIEPFNPEVIGAMKESHHEFHDKIFCLESLDQLEQWIEHYI